MTATADAPPIAPGVHTMPEADYHAATWALSASGAKLILDCPARFRWVQDHPVRKREFDIGSAAHKLVLGSGPVISVIDARCLQRLADRATDPKVAKLYAETAAKGDPTGWTTNAAKEARSQAYRTGSIPVLKADFDKVRAMADALRRHPLASALLDRTCGLPEQSLFWDDPEFGVPRRARFDWLPDPRGGRVTIADYKTCENASPDAIRKAVGNWAYHIQDATYREGCAALGLDDDPAFVFIFQEKEPPYLVNTGQLDAAAVQSGRVACRAAIEMFRDCTAADVWPGYGPEIADISLPPWATRIPEDYYQ